MARFCRGLTKQQKKGEITTAATLIMQRMVTAAEAPAAATTKRTNCNSNDCSNNSLLNTPPPPHDLCPLLSPLRQHQPLPAVVLNTVEQIEDEAKRCCQGDVRRVMNVVKLAVVCRGAKEAADFCRKLKQHPQVLLSCLVFCVPVWWLLPALAD